MAEFNEAEFLQTLGNFHGTETWYRHGLNRAVLFTEGAKYVADQCGAYWLLDEIAIGQMLPQIAAEAFQVWLLTVNDGRGVLTCEDGNYRAVFKKQIAFTDFPLNEMKLLFCGGTIMLPGEY
jgi:hypothetical protein